MQLPLTFLSLFIATLAGPIPKGKRHEVGFLKLPAKKTKMQYRRMQPYNPFASRWGSANVPVENHNLNYEVEVLLGSNQQPVRLTLDTGSSDLWVNWNKNPYCAAVDSGNEDFDYSRANQQRDPNVQSALKTLNPSMYSTIMASISNAAASTASPTTASADTAATGEPGEEGSQGSAIYPTATFDFVATGTASPDWYDDTCAAHGMFDYSKSFSYKSKNTMFGESYTGGFGIGVWSDDILIIDGITIPHATFGLGMMSSTALGVLGLGPVSGEITNSPYPNMPAALKQQGVIKRESYSIFLGSEGTDNSHVLFGGIDQAKFQSKLGLLPLVPSYGNQFYEPTVAVTLSGLYAVQKGSGSSKFGCKKTTTTLLAQGLASALFDTGSPMNYAPYYVINAIVAAFGDTFKYSDSLGNYVANVSDLEGKSLIFDFQGIKITVPMIGLVTNIVDFNKKSTGLCYLAFLNAGVDELILGDGFLRSVYFMADYENMQMGLAQALPYASNENIQPIPEKGKYIPNMTTAPSYTKTYATGGVTTLSLATSVNPSTFQTTQVTGTVLPDFFFPLPR